MLIKNQSSLKKGSSLKLIVSALFLILLVFLIFSAETAAFSDYEQDAAKELYQDLEKQYQIEEFSAQSSEYRTLKRLENSIVHKKFKDSNFKIHHVKDELVNAYYIGDGNIMLFEGLLQKLNSETQLAALIAHEMGHAVNEHLTEDLQRNLGLSVLNLLFNHFTDNEYQTISSVAQNLIANGYSREQEEESDIYAVDLMMRSSYNPEGLVELMEIFKENSNSVKLLEFTQTHPIPESRIEYLKNILLKKEKKNLKINKSKLWSE